MRMAAQASKQNARGGRDNSPSSDPANSSQISSHSPSRWTRMNDLWQAPLLIVSVGLFGAAAWLFIDPKPGLSIDQKIEVARTFLAQSRPEAAIEQLNRLLDKERLERDREAEIHLLLAESLEQGQKQKKLNIPENHRRNGEQTVVAMEKGAKPTAAMNQRLAEPYEARGRPTESLMYYRGAGLLNPPKALWLQRKIIDLQLAADDQAGAAGS